MTRTPVRNGVDRFVAAPGDALTGRRVALLTNQAALLADGTPTLEALPGHPDLDVVALFAFEHGLSGFGEDARPTPDARDRRTGLPVRSLYGPRRRPDAGDVRDLDAIVIDVQEVGVRCYTYAATAALLLDVAADAGTRVVVCDRPSLLGPRVAGPARSPDRISFLAYPDVPFQHGLTLGETIRRHAAAHAPNADLVVVPTDAPGRPNAHRPVPYVPPSPGLPTADAALLYPGLVLLEGTNLSEGRGTPAPFSLIGAPWLEGTELARIVRAVAPPGLLARPLAFEPVSGRYAGRVCEGVQLHVTDPEAVSAFDAVVRILTSVRERWSEFAWVDAAEMPWSAHPDAGRPWHEPSSGPLVDGLAGDATVRAVVDGRVPFERARAEWTESGRAFLRSVEAALLYAPRPEAG